jgi:hypothetical protein
MAIAIQPIIKATPPNGVIAPNTLISVKLNGQPEGAPAAALSKLNA